MLGANSATGTPAAVSGGSSQPILAGAVAAVVGFASTFAVVLAGLRGVGASPSQAASGLFAVCAVMAVASAGLSLRTRMPILLAWSTPGAALLVGAGPVSGGYAAAVGAFMVCGALLALAGLWGALGKAIARIPIPVASAMLAGVLLPLCLAPVRAAVDIPAAAGPVIATWALLSVLARRWAVPGALLAAIFVVVAFEPLEAGPTGALPVLDGVVPSLSVGALLGVALPLFVVTMASQNVPGMGVLVANGYRPPLRPILATTGGTTVLGAPFGVFAVNLAAITAALVAGPEAHPDPARRWVAAVASGATYLVLGLSAGLATALVTSAPDGLIEAVAGLALLGALGGSLSAALEAPEHREPAVVTFVVSASAITTFGLSSAFWGLAAGLTLMGLQRVRAVRPPRAAEGSAAAEAPAAPASPA
ncbi:MAG: benzoate/H(+) symporter BenE family transporter [Solirubrobacterales bacterium]|nr:benzoate/H(+) symporter BenE family transporter [Solirubrobacterales bacterium]